jgi:hypothetical protein
MTECFIEEFMRLGYNAKQILALFRNPHYIGMNMALEKRGEQFVRDRIDEIFGQWGRPGLKAAGESSPAHAPSESARDRRSPKAGDIPDPLRHRQAS